MRRRVTEQARDSYYVLAIREKQRREGVPQIVESNLSQPCAAQGGIEASL